jgi:hypothetical protein
MNLNIIFLKDNRTVQDKSDENQDPEINFFEFVFFNELFSKQTCGKIIQKYILF